MKTIENILRFLSRLLAWLSAVCIMLMMLHVCGDVILKYAIKKPIIGTAEVVAYYYMVAAVFLPLPLVEFRNAGVSVTLFYDLIKSVPVKRMMTVVAYIGQILFFAMLAYRGWLDALISFGKLEIVEGQTTIFIWPGTFFLPLGFGLAVLVSTLRLFQVMFKPDWERIVG